MKNNLILLAGICLLFFGFFGENLRNNIPLGSNISVENYVIDAPSDDDLLLAAKQITKILQESDDSTRKKDCLKLSSLYSDIATLIELDEEDEVIKDTATIRQANALSGKMLRLNIKNKYPNLADSTNNLLIDSLGDEDVALDQELRSKAATAFRALSWAFYEGSK